MSSLSTVPNIPAIETIKAINYFLSVDYDDEIEVSPKEDLNPSPSLSSVRLSLKACFVRAELVISRISPMASITVVAYSVNQSEKVCKLTWFFVLTSASMIYLMQRVF